MIWSELNFGKHVGKTLPQVLFIDPDWFFWAIDTGVFNQRPKLAMEAKLLNKRAIRIKIPRTQYGDSVVEYLVHRPTMKFSHFQVVPRDREPDEGSSPAFRSNEIDVRFPRRIAQYDKTGCKSLVSSLKFYLFGSESARITKDRAESFFADPGNFE